MDFIKDNIMLIGLALGSGVMLLMPSLKKNANGVPNLTSAEAVMLINRANALVLDVRNADEFEAGHITDAMNIAVEDLPNHLNDLKKYKNKAILVNCQRGARGAKACDILRQAEFTQVNHLAGGLDAWLKANLPVITTTKETVKKSNPKKAASSLSEASNDAARETDHA